MKHSRIIEFYEGDGKDHQGRTFEEIMTFDDVEFEQCHDFIQWLFPLHEASRMTEADIPILTREESDYLSSSDICRERMEEAVNRFVVFLGNTNWDTPRNHNLLRITRIIRSLRLFGLPIYARAFYIAVEIASENADAITRTYWKRALEEPLFDTLQI